MNISTRRLVPATVLAVLASLLLAVPAQAAEQAARLRGALATA